MPNPKQFRDDLQNAQLYIGQVSQITGASRKAIRLYESQGLIPTPQRRGNYRVYNGRHIFAVHVIKHAQGYGFSLAELQELMHAINRQPNFPREEALAIVKRKRESVQQQIVALRQLDKRIAALIKDIKTHFK